MKKTIYQALGFRSVKELVYSHDLINKARDLFAQLPLRNVAMRQLIIEENLYAESLAISTAEDSDLTKEEAEKIELSPEVEARLLKYRNDQTLPDEEKYRHLEYENILSTEMVVRPMGFKEIDLNFLCDLHFNLTIGLDEYGKAVGHFPYYPGKLRKSDDIKVGKLQPYVPPKHTQIASLVKLLVQDYSKKKTVQLADIFEFTLLLYAIHPFANGNKRVVRLIESILLLHYGYSLEGMLSMAVFYQEKKDSFHFFLLTSLQQKDVQPFVNFALRGYLASGLILARQTFSVYGRHLADISFNFVKNSVTEKYQHRFMTALEVIGYLNWVFTQTQFIQIMKEKGFSPMMSRQVIELLKDKKLLKLKNRALFLGESMEINQFATKIADFLVANEIYLDSLYLKPSELGKS